jgi:hypothetical protein
MNRARVRVASRFGMALCAAWAVVWIIVLLLWGWPSPAALSQYCLRDVPPPPAVTETSEVETHYTVLPMGVKCAWTTDSGQRIGDSYARKWSYNVFAGLSALGVAGVILFGLKARSVRLTSQAKEL